MPLPPPMAEALIRGLLGRGVVSPSHLMVTNRSNTARLEDLRYRYAVQTTRKKPRLTSGASIIILAVKPKDMAEVLRELSGLINAAIS